MAVYLPLSPSQRLSNFFSELFHQMRKANPSAYAAFLMRAEQEFKRLGYREKVSSGVENILIVRLDVIGDMVLTSGFIREVRANFPNARITLVVSPLVFPIVEFCPYVNEVLTFDRNSLAGTFCDSLERVAVFCKEHLWQKKFSVAFSPQCGGYDFPNLLMLWLSGARERIGYGMINRTDGMNEFLLSKPLIRSDNIIAQVEKHFHVLTAVGLKVNQTHMELFYGAEELQHAKELLEDLPPSCKKILIGISAGAAGRKYPVEKYLIALKNLAKKNFVFVITGGKTESEDAAYLEKNLPSGKVLNLVGKTTLRETEAVISLMDFYIGNDSGVMHMAAAAKVPVLAIYREAVDRQNVSPMRLSEFLNFPPWQTKSVILRPKHPLGECATLPPIYGHCHHENESHCITQITPQEIVTGFNKLCKMAEKA